MSDREDLDIVCEHDIQYMRNDICPICTAHGAIAVNKIIYGTARQDHMQPEVGPELDKLNRYGEWAYPLTFPQSFFHQIL